MCGADAIKIGDGELALLRAATAENDIPGSKTQFRCFNVIRRAPSTYAERVRIEVFKTDVAVHFCFGRIIDAVIHNNRHFIEAPHVPAVLHYRIRHRTSP